MKATTGQILGKAHKLCEWLVREDFDLFNSGLPSFGIASAIKQSTKWHIGSADELPNIGRDTIDSMPLRTPCSLALFELDIDVFFDGVVFFNGTDTVKRTVFILCEDNGDGFVSLLFFRSTSESFEFEGGGRIQRSEAGNVFNVYSNWPRAIERAEETRKLAAVFESALVLLHCTNVRSVDNTPPKGLNKKRQKTGKPPLFTYKTLHILAGERGPSHDPRADAAEAKRSPRLHFRRGHVRRIGDGRITWVQQCMVGNRRLGVVEKAYALEAR